MAEITCGAEKQPCRCHIQQLSEINSLRVVIDFCDGSKYEGDFKCGNAHGQGSLIFANGDRYTGCWEKNKKHGFGSYEYASGASYIGKWCED